MTARLGEDMLGLQLRNSFANPGALRVLDVPVDLRRLTLDSYLLGASTDHIMPWADCYRTRALLSGTSRFVPATGGHAKVLGVPPGSPRLRYRTGTSDSADPAEWLDTSIEHQGSWWEDWSSWITSHTPEIRPAPARPVALPIRPWPTPQVSWSTGGRCDRACRRFSRPPC